MRLPAVLAEYGRELEADLLSEYGVDLSDLYTGRLTPRRCWLLIEQLPPGSRFAVALGGDGAWDVTGHLLAGLLGTVQSIGAGRRVKPPAPPEPGWRERRRGPSAADSRRAARISRM